jgi:excisionase family DNA binding protein
MPCSYQVFRNKSWTCAENGVIVRKKEADMARLFAPISAHFEVNDRFGVPEFEPLLNSEQAAQLLQIHHKTLQRLARSGEIRGTQIGKLWRFRVSDLNAWFERNQRAG